MISTSIFPMKRMLWIEWEKRKKEKKEEKEGKEATCHINTSRWWLKWPPFFLSFIPFVSLLFFFLSSFLFLSSKNRFNWFMKLKKERKWRKRKNKHKLILISTNWCRSFNIKLISLISEQIITFWIWKLIFFFLTFRYLKEEREKKGNITETEKRKKGGRKISVH